MEKENKLVRFIDWTIGKNGNFREFSSVIEVHYYLLGYQISESDNGIKNGHGHWISDFMIFCEQETSRSIKNLDKQITSESGSYYSYIVSIQKSNTDGLRILYDLYKRYISITNNQ